MATQARRMKRYHPPGTSPGTLRPPEGPEVPLRVTVIDYGPDRLIEKEVHSVAELAPYKDTPTVTWINVEGLHDIAFLEGWGSSSSSTPWRWRTSSTAASGRSWRTTGTTTSW
jgi:magnesium transporter